MDYDALRTPQDDIVRDGAEFQAYLAPAELIDSGHPDIVAYAAAKAGQGDDRTRALRLYYAVRDDLRYDPYNTAMRPEAYRASTTLAARHIMASGALPPGFPPVEIDGRLWWDGGIVSNAPLAAILGDEDGINTLSRPHTVVDVPEAQPLQVQETEPVSATGQRGSICQMSSSQICSKVADPRDPPSATW